MKKLLIWICMITCIFGLTACGSEEVLTEYEQLKVGDAQLQATGNIVPLLADLMGEDAAGIFDEYTMEEVEDWVNRVAAMYNTSIEVDGYAFYSAVQSFQSAADSVGIIQEIGSSSAKIDGDQIIVEVEVVGEKKNATAEVIFSNDRFLVLESAALNPESGMGELMTGAALNTVIGMGTVFLVLLLISAIISCFKVIPNLQKKAAQKKAGNTESQQEVKVKSPVVQAAVQEESADDDTELVAVIAAAIAAYEGAASTEGFQVRSIRRRR